MPHIPSDVRREIFLRLPAKSLIRFRAVCKGWRAVIDDPRFVIAHTNKQLSSNTILIRNSTGPPFYPLYSFDLETLNFTNGLHTIAATPLSFTRGGLSRLSNLPAAACNGLMLITPSPMDKDRKGNWEIWNTLTHERLELPRRDFNWHAIGLGYDSATDDYKAVVIVALSRRGRRGREKHVYQTHIYSLKSDSWRRIMNCPCDNDWGLNSFGPGVFLSGALHWISSWDNNIIALDLGTESYRQLTLLPLHERDCEDMVIRQQQLDVLGGCLFVSDYGQDDYLFKHFDVWVMKDYGEDSWMKLFSVEEYDIPDLGCSLRPVAYMKNKMQVFMQDRLGFYLFDVESNSAKMSCIHGLSGILTAQVFHESIYRLHDNCGISGGGTRERRIRKRTSKMKMADTKLMFCVRDAESRCYSHDSCYSIDSNWYYLSSEDEDV